MMKEVSIFLDHILDNIEKIESFSKGISKEELAENELKKYAIIKAIEIIGEASKNIPESFKIKYSSIPWKEIIGSRDKMIHHYFGVDLDIVWNIIKKDLPSLKEKVFEIKKDLEKQEKAK